MASTRCPSYINLSVTKVVPIGKVWRHGLNRVLTVSEAARELGRSEKWLRNAERKGKIPRARRDLNGWRVYTPEDIAKLQKLLLGSRNTTEVA